MSLSVSSSSAAFLHRHSTLSASYSSSFLKSQPGAHRTRLCQPLPSSRFNYPKINAVNGANVLERSNKVVELDEDDKFVEVGWIRSTHGVGGEVKVLSRTDFPEQRFEQPGIRWVGFNRMGKYTGIQQIRLLSGRNIVQGKEPTWLLTFEGFDTLEKATELIGTTLLVKNSDRPALSGDQIYVPELIGMSVILKESGEAIGSIVDIFNSGASDLLRVKLSASCKSSEESEGNLVWIPFVEEIVPVVDQQSRFVEIVPPKGLLELNRPSKKPEKLELRKQALKSRRKLQERISGVKKRVLALKQEHILSGLTHGEDLQKEALKAQLLSIDFKSFKRAIETSLEFVPPSMDSEAFSIPSDIATLMDWKGLEQWLRSPSRENMTHGGMVNKRTWRLWQEGLQLICQRRVAIVTVALELPPDAPLESTLEFQAGQLLTLQELGEFISGEKSLISWVLLLPEVSTARMKELLQQRAYFGLSEDQVFLVESSYLPLVNSSREEGLHKILMESLYRIHTGAAGDGQVISDLDDSGVLDRLVEMGVDYVHMVYSKDMSSQLLTDPAVFGFIKEQEACVALKVTSGMVEGDHGILGITKASPDRRKRTIMFSPASGAAAEDGRTNMLSTEHYMVLRQEEPTSTAFVEDHDNVYRVLPSCSYTFSVEYLRHLSQLRYELVYEAELKSVAHMSSMEGPHENNAWQLKCSPHSALLFCSPSQVALLHL